jgi:hypothetical protein
MRFRDERPAGTLSGEQCRAMILTKAKRHLDAYQWRAVAKRKGVRRVSGTRIITDPASGSERRCPLWCYAEADLVKLLPWLKRADDRDLDIVDPSELPTIDEIWAEARKWREFRDLESGQVDSSPEDQRAPYIIPENVRPSDE